MNPLNIICYLKFIEEGKNYVFVQKLNSNILENLKLEFHRERALVGPGRMVFVVDLEA
jgi:hypothetical protein